MATIIAGDVGNANIKMKSEHGKTDFPHALFKLTGSQVADLETGGEGSPNIYRVNGVLYAIGEQAVRNGAGAAKYGEERYVPEYYGVLAAIGLFRVLPESAKDIYYLGTHTPKDNVYKQDLIDAVKGSWVVENMGARRAFRVATVVTIDEPSAHYRHATLYDGGESYRGPERLRRGTCAIIDIGGLTTGFASADSGRMDYTAGNTRVRGILDAIWELEKLLWQRYSKELKGQKVLSPIRLRDALMDGEYDAGGLGVLTCAKEAEEAGNIVVSDVLAYFNDYGGASSFDSVLLAGGGGALLKARLMKHLNHRAVYASDENPDKMFMGAALGGYKILQALQSKGRL